MKPDRTKQRSQHAIQIRPPERYQQRQKDISGHADITDYGQYYRQKEHGQIERAVGADRIEEISI